MFEVAKVNLFRKKVYSDPIYYFPFVSLYSHGSSAPTSSPGRFSLALEVGPTSKAREKRPGDEVASAPDRGSVPTNKGQAPRMNASEEG